MRVGGRIGDLGHAVQSWVEAHGFSVVREFVGHGIGEHLHEEPPIPNFGSPGRGARLAEGMVGRLNEREAETLLWVAQGKSNADIAGILGNSEKTVKKTLGHIFEKLGLESRTAAALQAVEVLSAFRRCVEGLSRR